jgi:hypothetical protein
MKLMLRLVSTQENYPWIGTEKKIFLCVTAVPIEAIKILYFIFEQSDWSMKQEVRNFLRNLSNC